MATFQIGTLLSALPFASLQVEVMKRSADGFLAVRTVALRDGGGSPDWLAGLGSSSDAALADLQRELADAIQGSPGLDGSSFEWADPHDVSDRTAHDSGRSGGGLTTGSARGEEPAFQPPIRYPIFVRPAFAAASGALA